MEIKYLKKEKKRFMAKKSVHYLVVQNAQSIETHKPQPHKNIFDWLTKIPKMKTKNCYPGITIKILNKKIKLVFHLKLQCLMYIRKGRIGQRKFCKLFRSPQALIRELYYRKHNTPG